MSRVLPWQTRVVAVAVLLAAACSSAPAPAPTAAPSQTQARDSTQPVVAANALVVSASAIASEIGNQVLRSFERAHEAGTVCRNLHVVWRGVGEMLNHARRILPQGRTGGVQALVLQRLLDEPRDATIAVFGLGEIGRAMLRALADAGFSAVESFNRASMRAFDSAVQRAKIVIVASGAPRAWLALPEGEGRRVFDLGSPLQLVAAPDWQLTSLDELLDAHGAVLPEDQYAALDTECATAAEKICQALLAPPPSDTLAAMTAMRTEFMQNKLPGLLEGLPPQRARKLTSEVNAMLHQFIAAARRES